MSTRIRSLQRNGRIASATYSVSLVLATAAALVVTASQAHAATGGSRASPPAAHMPAPFARPAINPQPLPPHIVDPSARPAINPQPLPPGHDPEARTAINPQPLPPEHSGKD